MSNWKPKKLDYNVQERLRRLRNGEPLTEKDPIFYPAIMPRNLTPEQRGTWEFNQRARLKEQEEITRRIAGINGEPLSVVLADIQKRKDEQEQDE
jgi:hypothetical protein